MYKLLVPELFINPGYLKRYQINAMAMYYGPKVWYQVNAMAMYYGPKV